MAIEIKSTITCPVCGFSKEEEMPMDACVVMYTCDQCMTTLRPKSGDCCVFCTYGSVKCPPIQREKGCCT